MTIYLDTSVAFALIVPEAGSQRIGRWFSVSIDLLVSSDWIVTEFASALAIKTRRGEIAAEPARAVWREFETLCGAGLRLLPVGRAAFAAAAQLSRNAGSGLRAGDSLHLAVALEAGVSALATTDAVLEANARKQGLKTVAF